MSFQRSVSYLAATLLALSTSLAFAQTPSEQAQDHPPHHEGKEAWQQQSHPHQMAKRLHHMMKVLHATEDQRHQILLIAENARHAMAVELAAIPKEAKLTRRAIRDKNMTQARADIHAVLTPEQRVKLDEYMAKHQPQHKQG